MFLDDAWYLLLAKALATGQGYTLINSPTPGILPLYPPGYPFLLSLVWRIAPQSPGNVFLLKSVSIAAMLLLGALTYRYLAREREIPVPLAALISGATILTPAFVFTATSTLMSECVFASLQMLTVVIIERAVRQTRFQWRLGYLLLGAGCASAAFLTRTMGVSLIVAVGIYLLKEQLYRSAAIFALVTGLFLGPWILYTRINAPTPE